MAVGAEASAGAGDTERKRNPSNGSIPIPGLKLTLQLSDASSSTLENEISKVGSPPEKKASPEKKEEAKEEERKADSPGDLKKTSNRLSGYRLR